MAKLIVAEGADKLGKETQSRLLVAKLRELGYTAVCIEVPVHDRLTHWLIYWMLRNGLASKYPNAFQYAQYLNRRIFQEFTLPVLEKKNDYVILDRWYLSTIIYGQAAGADVVKTAALCAKLRNPDMTIVLHGLAHVDQQDDVYEADNELQSRVSELYKEWAECRPACSLVSNLGTRLETHDAIMRELKLQGLI